MLTRLVWNDTLNQTAAGQLTGAVLRLILYSWEKEQFAKEGRL